MGDTQVLKEAIEILQITKNNVQRLYSYGLTPSDIRRLCTSISTTGDTTPLTITPLSAGEFGSADRLDYKGKQYVRKSQSVTITQRLSDQLEIPLDYSPFRNEIKVLRELNAHPILYKHVPVYYGHEEESGNGIYLMEYLKGETLQDLCEKRGLTKEEWDDILAQILTILQELHKTGYVFGDVHAGNFFIRVDERNRFNVILIDFGLTTPLQKSTPMDPTARQTIDPDRNNSAHNFLHLEFMKYSMKERFNLPACVRPVNESFPPLEYKPRDYETKTQLTEEQQRSVRVLDAQIQELELDLARKQQTIKPLYGGPLSGVTLPEHLQSKAPPSEYEGFARRIAGVSQQVIQAPKTILNRLNPFSRKGGRRNQKKQKQKQKQKQKKTRKRRV